MTQPRLYASIPTELQSEVLAGFVELGRAMQEDPDPRHLLDGFSRRVQSWIPHDRLAAASLSDDGRHFTIFAEQGGRLGTLHEGRYTGAAHPRSRYVVESWGIAPVFRGTPMLSSDMTTDPRFMTPDKGERVVIAAGLRAGIVAPMWSGGRVIGALIATRVEPRSLTETHLERLVLLANLVGPFVHGAVLLQRDRERRRKHSILEKFTKQLAGTLDLRGVFGSLADVLGDAIDFDVIGIVLVEGDEIRSLVEVDRQSQEPPPDRVPMASFSFAERVLRGDNVLFDDVSSELVATTEGERWIVASGVRTLLLTPLRMSELVGGVMYFAKRQPCWYDESDVELAAALAPQVALAIQHQHLAEQQARAAAMEKKSQMLARQVADLQYAADDKFGFRNILGAASSLREALDRASKVAPTEATVLITGESGTGKELVAKAIHAASPRALGPFLALNCAALPESLLESELFGYERGAFTGADRARAGRIEAAAGGTLFLDEIGELAPGSQAKLLRVLQEREYTRVGGTSTRKADVRVIAATNRDLSQDVEAGRFRADLYYRLDVFVVHLPPLRERGADVLTLAEHFVRTFEEKMGKSVAGLSREARAALLAHPWPGNIRELSNAVERAMILTDGGLILPEHLGLARASAARAIEAAPDASLPDLERRLVEEAMRKAGGNKSRAAKLLGVSRSKLYTRLKRAGLEP